MRVRSPPCEKNEGEKLQKGSAAMQGRAGKVARGLEKARCTATGECPLIPGRPRGRRLHCESSVIFSFLLFFGSFFPSQVLVDYS